MEDCGGSGRKVFRILGIRIGRYWSIFFSCESKWCVSVRVRPCKLVRERVREYGRECKNVVRLRRRKSQRPRYQNLK